MDETTLVGRLLQTARQSELQRQAILKFAARALPLSELAGLAEKFRVSNADTQREICRLASAEIIANPQLVRLLAPELGDVLDE
jgi:hypothetical protein